MRNRILGAIGVIWGGAVLLNWYRGSGAHGSGAYAAGYSTGVIFGALLFLVGGYYLLSGGGSKRPQ
ncbi:MAG TPA: hypothetical protein VNX02_10100 [Steroidobacteraceae bacterium]|jgi:hypothetical protein|nr:hypothetical protein [Steroidobacteraceae bacterium]